MSATLHRFSAADNHRAWAEREARRSALALVGNQPLIVRIECAGCQGKGSYVIAGCTYACGACNSRGYILAEEINLYDVEES